MNWQITILIIGFVALAFAALDSCGVYAWVHRRLNQPAPAPLAPRHPIVSVGDMENVKHELANQRADIDKMKIALGIKELRRP